VKLCVRDISCCIHLRSDCSSLLLVPFYLSLPVSYYLSNESPHSFCMSVVPVSCSLNNFLPFFFTLHTINSILQKVSDVVQGKRQITSTGGYLLKFKYGKGGSSGNSSSQGGKSAPAASAAAPSPSSSSTPSTISTDPSPASAPANPAAAAAAAATASVAGSSSKSNNSGDSSSFGSSSTDSSATAAAAAATVATAAAADGGSSSEDGDSGEDFAAPSPRPPPSTTGKDDDNSSSSSDNKSNTSAADSTSSALVGLSDEAAVGHSSTAMTSEVVQRGREGTEEEAEKGDISVPPAVQEAKSKPTHDNDDDDQDGEHMNEEEENLNEGEEDENYGMESNKDGNEEEEEDSVHNARGEEEEEEGGENGDEWAAAVEEAESDQDERLSDEDGDDDDGYESREGLLSSDGDSIHTNNEHSSHLGERMPSAVDAMESQVEDEEMNGMEDAEGDDEEEEQYEVESRFGGEGEYNESEKDDGQDINGEAEGPDIVAADDQRNGFEGGDSNENGMDIDGADEGNRSEVGHREISEEGEEGSVLHVDDQGEAAPARSGLSGTCVGGETADEYDNERHGPSAPTNAVPTAMHAAKRGTTGDDEEDELESEGGIELLDSGIEGSSFTENASHPGSNSTL